MRGGLPRGVCPGGVSTRGVSAQGVVFGRGGYSAQGVTDPPVDRICVKTLPYPNFVAGGKNKKRHSLLAINTKYGVPIMNVVISIIVEMSGNNIAMWISVSVDGRTAELAIIALVMSDLHGTSTSAFHLSYCFNCVQLLLLFTRLLGNNCSTDCFRVSHTRFVRDVFIRCRTRRLLTEVFDAFQGICMVQVFRIFCIF